MLLKCLGSGDAFGTGGRLNTCFYLESNGLKILIDCGASSLIALNKANLDPQSIDIIILSHLHGDHFGGIPFLIRETQIARHRGKPLTIIGPADTETKVSDALDCLFPSSSPLLVSFELNYITYSTNGFTPFQGVSVSVAQAFHTKGTNPHSLRIELDDQVIVYSGDTEWYDGLVTLSTNADIFICEGYTYSERKKNHMWIGDLIKNADRITAKKTVLTHLSQEALEHISDIPFYVVNDGEILLNANESN
jgi:ribonuclease BN (tRNA processing enzyme)